MIILKKIKQYEKEDKEITTNKIKKSIAQVEQQDKLDADDLLQSLDTQVV